MALTRVTDLVDEIEASQLNQFAKLLEGDTGAGQPVSLTALNDLTSYAFQAANQDATNGRAMRILKPNLTDPWIDVTVSGVTIEKLRLREISDPVAPGSNLMELYPGTDNLLYLIAGSGGIKTLVIDEASFNARTSRRNKLVNGGFRVQQRATLPTADNSYALDRWRLLAETTSTGAVISQETTDVPSGGSRAACKLAVGASNNTMSGIFQPIEGADIWDLRGQTANLQATLKVSNARIGSIRMAVLQWTGTEDSVSADPINGGGAWPAAGTNPTLTTNWAYANTPAGASTGAITPTTSYVTYKVEGISLSASMTNAAVLIWIDDKTTTAGDYLLVTDVELARGTYCTQIERRPLVEEDRLCKWWYEVIGSGINTEQFVNVSVYNSTVGYATLNYQRKRTIPTVTPSAAATFTFLNTAGGTLSIIANDLAGLDRCRLGLTLSGATAGQAGLLYSQSTSGKFTIAADL